MSDSAMFTISTAARENVKLKIGLAGPSGAGKTYSALLLAYGIAAAWEKIGVADTENKSALYYADMGPWRHIAFDPDAIDGGYHPRNYIKLIRFAEQQGLEVLIIDSISHEWEGKGGCLELVDQIGKGFASWKTVTPHHNAFMDAVRLSPLHVIATMRSKQDYVVEQNEKGKSAPKKVGLKAIQREGADYDFGLVFDIHMNHFATSGKDRTGLFSPRGEFKITPGTGEELIEWATSAIERPPEVYSGTAAQKARLVEVCKAAGLHDGAKMRSIHQTMLTAQVEMANLRAAVLEWLEGHHGT